MAKCKGKTKAGKACRGPAIKDTKDGMLDPKFCMGHQTRSAKDALGFGGPQEGSGPERKPRTIDRLREKVEELTDEIIAPFVEGLTAEVCIGHRKDPDDPDGPRIPIMIPDHRRRQDSSRELMDRAYGKPKQVSEISGPEGGPIETTAGVAIPAEAGAGDLVDLADKLRQRREAK